MDRDPTTSTTIIKVDESEGIIIEKTVVEVQDD